LGPTSTTYLIPLALRAAAARGVDAEKIAARFQFPANLLSMRQVALPILAQGEVLEAIAREAGDPLFGVHLAAEHPKGGLGLIEYVFRTAATVGEGLLALSRFSSMTNSALVFTLERDARTFAIRDVMSLGRQWNEWLFAFVLGLVRQMVARELVPDAVRFTHDGGPHRRQIERAFRAGRVEFRSDENAISFQPEHYGWPLSGADPVLHELLVEQAELKTIASRGESPLVLQVRELVRQELPERLLTLEGAAERLGRPARWLQRSLASEKTTYLDVVASVRMEVARQLLRGPKTVLEIALELHYSDATALTRAFRRATGMTPAAFRGAR
jgi:AraC-like DNA-binding protein